MRKLILLLCLTLSFSAQAQNKKKPGQSITFVRLADKRPSEGWGGAGNTVTTPVAKTAPAASQATPKTPMDLTALLG